MLHKLNAPFVSFAYQVCKERRYMCHICKFLCHILLSLICNEIVCKQLYFNNCVSLILCTYCVYDIMLLFSGMVVNSKYEMAHSFNFRSKSRGSITNIKDQANNLATLSRQRVKINSIIVEYSSILSLKDRVFFLKDKTLTFK